MFTNCLKSFLHFIYSVVNMKKILNLLFFLAIMQEMMAQSETFNIATYTPPKDWKKDGNTGVVTYTDINTSTGGFCIVAIYACTSSLGDAQKDFQSEWMDRVSTPHQAEANPKTESEITVDGWKAVTAAAPIKVQDLDAYAILTVFSGFGKKFSVLATLNDQNYVTGIDALLHSIKLDKKGTVTVASPLIQGITDQHESKNQFGTMIYRSPNGWNVTKYPDGDIISPADLPKSEFLEIWIHPSMNFTGTIEEALQKSYDDVVVQLQATKMRDVNGGNYNKVAAKTSFKGWEYIRCNGGIRMGGGDYPPEYGLDLFMIKLNGRFEWVSIVKSRKNCSYSTYYATDRINYNNAVENFLFSLQFPDWKEPFVKTGIAKGDGITGVWQGIAMSVGIVKPGASLGAELKVKQLIFFSNGQAYFGTNFPAEGLDGMNTWVRAENSRRDWGTYSFANGRGVLKLPYADIPLRQENGKLVITTNNTEHGFIKSVSVDGATFNGTYALSSKNFLGEETGKKPVIQFTSDGQFSDNGALKILSHTTVDCLNPAKEPGNGTYEVKNYSVVFNYADGRKLKIAMMGNDYNKSNPSPATLVLSFNEDLLRRQ